MNGIYLYLLLREIRDKLVGSHIEDIKKRWRIIEVVLNQYSLVISLHPATLGMYLSKSSMSDYESLKAFAEPMRSYRVADIVQDNFAPVMRMIIEEQFPGKEQMEVIISLYHEAPNFSVRAGSWQKNIFTRFIEKKTKSSILVLKDLDIKGMDAESMVKNIEGIDSKMARSLDESNLRILRSVLQGRVVRPRLISTQPLHISLFEKSGAAEFVSFNELFKQVIRQLAEELYHRQVERDRSLQIRRLNKRKTRLKKKLLTTEEIESLRRCGEMILANIAVIERGSSSVELTNPYTKNKMTLRLDPRLTPQANAQRYFLRYKKEKKGQPRLREEIAKAENEIVRVGRMPGAARVEKKEGVKKESKREPFHKFNLPSGSVVFVGKNARSNDQLTFQQARSGDYFFHARGVEGAHTILRPNVPKRQRPGKDEIKTAAAIAAYFSKSRTQKNVPVSFTQRKYLKKDKRGKPGTVIMMREEVLFVDPGLPT